MKTLNVGAHSALAALLLSLLLAATPACTDPVCIHAVDDDGAVTFFADARSEGLTVTFTATTKNMEPRTRTVTRVLRRGRNELLTVRAASKKEYRWDYDYRWKYGTAGAKHDDRVSYRLPFQTGRDVLLFQGPYGSISHRNKAAYDFPAPRGTPVYAARGGQVIYVVDEFGEGGNDMKYWEQVNKICILHSDGTVGSYLHLQRGAMAVKQGDRVEAGTLIGRSGNSGYSSGPHLHFEVFRLIDAIQPEESISVRFRTEQGMHVQLETGKTYRVR